MRTVRLTLALLGTLAALSATTSAAHAAPTRCQAAGQLRAGDVDDVAARQYEKSLNVADDRNCAVDGLMQLHEAAARDAADKTKATPCQVGDQLFAAGFDDQAKAQYDKAVGEDATRACGIAGLEKLDDDERRTTWGEVWDAITGWAGTAWPLPAALVVLWALAFLYRLLVRRGGLRVIPGEGDADLATLVMDAVNTTGSGGRPPAKLVVGDQQEVGAKTVAQVTKLLGIPGSVPLDALLYLAWWPWRLQRLKIAYSEGGGWAVLDVKLHRLLRTPRHARLSIQLEHEDKTVRQEVLSLVAGAWLATVFEADHRGAPVWYRDWDAAIAHAYFRAGANLQDRAQPERAMACYAAMGTLRNEDGTPAELEKERAPGAWIGARLNLMMLMKKQGRVAEALALAAVTRTAAQEVLDEAAYREWYGAGPLAELRRRTKYLISLLYEELCAQEPSPGAPAVPHVKANAAAAELGEEILLLAASEPTNPLLRPMLLIHLGTVVRLSAPVAAVRERDVDAVLTDDLEESVGLVPIAPVTPAAYYDAACTLALMPDPTKERCLKALHYLGLAITGSSKDSRPRVREMAADDPMLAKLKPTGFRSQKWYAEALGADDEPSKDEDAKKAA